MGHGERTRKRPILNELSQLIGSLSSHITLAWSARELQERLEAAQLETCSESLFPLSPSTRSQEQPVNSRKDKPAVRETDSKLTRSQEQPISIHKVSLTDDQVSSFDMTNPVKVKQPKADKAAKSVVESAVDSNESFEPEHVDEAEVPEPKKAKKSKKSKEPETEPKKKRSRSERNADEADQLMQDADDAVSASVDIDKEKKKKKKRRAVEQDAETDDVDMLSSDTNVNIDHIPEQEVTRPKKRSRKAKDEAASRSLESAEQVQETDQADSLSDVADSSENQSSDSFLSIPILEPISEIKWEPDYLGESQIPRQREANARSSQSHSKPLAEPASSTITSTVLQSAVLDNRIHQRDAQSSEQAAAFVDGMQEIDVGADEEDQEPGLPAPAVDAVMQPAVNTISLPRPPVNRLKKEHQPVRVIRPSVKSTSLFSRHQLVTILNSLRSENGKLNQYSSNLLPESILVSHIKSSMAERFQSLLQEQLWTTTHLKSLALMLRLVLTRPDMPHSSSLVPLGDAQLHPPYLDADMKELIGAVVEVLVMTQPRTWDVITSRSIAESIIQSRTVLGLSDPHVAWAQSLLDRIVPPRPPAHVLPQPHIISSASRSPMSNLASPARASTAASAASSVSVKSEPGAAACQPVNVIPVTSVEQSDATVGSNNVEPRQTSADDSKQPHSSAESSSSDDDSSDSDSDDAEQSASKPSADESADPFDDVAHLPLVDAVARLKPKFIVLDSVNIGRWNGSSGSLFDSAPSPSQQQAKKQQPPFHSWQLAAAVKEVEEKLGVPALCYIPETFVRSPANVGVTDLNPLEELFKAKKLFWLPSGADDDSELIKLAMKHKTWIVTNDNFRDHVYHQVIDRKFTTQRCIKFYTTVMPGDEIGTVELIDPIKLKANAGKQGVKLQDSTHYLPLIQQQQQAMQPQMHQMKYQPQMPYHYMNSMQMAMPMHGFMQPQPQIPMPPGFAPPGFMQYQPPMQYMMPPPPTAQQQQQFNSMNNQQHEQQQQQQQQPEQ